MNIIKMSQFGSFLTGRDFGKKTMKDLEPQLRHPVALDFSGTISLGSSFGDEILPIIAQKQGGTIGVLNANKAVWDCLTRIAAASDIAIVKVSEESA